MLRFLFYSNIFIGLATVALTYAVASLHGVSLSLALGLHIFFDTVFIYALHRLVSLFLNAVPSKDPRQATLIKNKAYLVLGTIMSIIGGAVTFFYLERFAQVMLIVPGVLALLYILPIFSHRRRLRDFNYLKIFFIAFSWAWVILLIPLNYVYISQNTLSILLRFISILFFIFAITLPFDIRDLNIDKSKGVKTIAQDITIPKLKQLSFISLIISLSCYIIGYYLGLELSSTIVSTLCAFSITAIIIQKTTLESKDSHYTGWLDGTILFYAICLELGHFVVY